MPKLKKLPKVLLHSYTLLVVTVGFVVFRADSISEAVCYIGQMFAGFDFSAGVMSFALQTLTPWFICMLVAAIVGCGPAARVTEGIRQLEYKETLTKREKTVQTVSFVLAGALLVWCILRLAGGSYNPFIYFRF